MRAQLEAQYTGKRIYLFTSMGQVYVGTLDAIVEDVVQLSALDRATKIYINLADVSGVRACDQPAEEHP
ncbi:hypothetical protein [Sorangium sp. So ce341]|uniref:hypothetical protein n=1 Tax=Sorangium sp. So ce341 TaxID=3133302 RepID=UPI003F637DC6